MKSLLMNLAEQGKLPDPVIRTGIRKLLKDRLALLHSEGETTADLITRLKDEPVAVATDAANQQHYEVPTRFFMKVLGPRMKYSSCIWPDGVNTLADAEKAMLDLTCKRAELADRMDILELGCGWGSLTLWMAEHFPNARILAVSNSATQRAHIETQALDRGYGNIEVRTCDMNDFDPGRTFDRIVSVEMFEHMRNPGKLLDRTASWLNPAGKVFIHIFTHDGKPYLFENHGREQDWMSKYFFTGGMMPSIDYLPAATTRLTLEDSWRVNGTHYAKTLEAWLQRQDTAAADILPILEKTYGPAQAKLWAQRWRMFWMACAELFNYNHGEEWPVHHYRFTRKPD